jgi:hypothetical protein
MSRRDDHRPPAGLAARTAHGMTTGNWIDEPPKGGFARAGAGFIRPNTSFFVARGAALSLTGNYLEKGRDRAWDRIWNTDYLAK